MHHHTAPCTSIHYHAPTYTTTDVLDPVLTVACATAYRSPFVMAVDGSREAGKFARRAFSDEAGGGSDHLAVARAFRAWEIARLRGGNGAEREFNRRHSTSGATMNMLKGMRAQLVTALGSRGLARDLPSASGNADAGALAREIERLSRREDVSAILTCVTHCVGPAATLTRAELRQRLAAFDIDGDGVLEASEALDAARALGADDEDTSLVARAAVLAARSGSVTVAALERAALGDDYVARCLGGVLDPAGGSTAAPSERSRPPTPATPASPAMPPPVADEPACFSCVFAKSA